MRTRNVAPADQHILDCVSGYIKNQILRAKTHIYSIDPKFWLNPGTRAGRVVPQPAKQLVDETSFSKILQIPAWQATTHKTWSCGGGPARVRRWT
jgi:hypothetical protein